MYSDQIRKYELNEKITVSIIIPTFNESENILQLIDAIHKNMPKNLLTEIIVIDDNSPDGTGKIIDSYVDRITTNAKSGLKSNNLNILVRVLHRKQRSGLASAILDGIKLSQGENILVMDADFSHPPEIIPSLVKELTLDPECDMVIASRYIKGGSITGWPIKRKILSNGATMIARLGLKIKGVKDPMSGFFLFRRSLIKNVTFDTEGYKILLEMLVKKKGIRVKEIPYNFVDRKSGKSKLDSGVIIDYIRAVWRLYRYGRKSQRVLQFEEKRKSVLFVSKAWRFYSVGATGLLVNYSVSFLLSKGILSGSFYLYATAIGIACSMTSNFFLNKAWTFEDRNFSFKRTARQYGLYVGFSTIGAIVQLSLVYAFIQFYGLQYPISLFVAVAIASAANFLLNKKWTFGERVWG